MIKYYCFFPQESPPCPPSSQLQPGKYQPRTRMDKDSLAELAESIKSQGIMQPVLVRPVSAGRYEIIAGERRWRAAQLAALAEVPALVREVPDEAVLAMSLIENIQREDLNPRRSTKSSSLLGRTAAPARSGRTAAKPLVEFELPARQYSVQLLQAAVMDHHASGPSFPRFYNNLRTELRRNIFLQP